jgi:hypothetical protein
VRARIADRLGVAKIIDDDLEPEISVSGSTGAETNANHTRQISVSLSVPSGKPVIVDFHTDDDSAIAGPDYTALNDELTIAPGTGSTTIPLAIVGDLTAEDGSEAIAFYLSDPVNAREGAMSAPVEIKDDDAGAGEIVITEMMIDPTDPTEWFEVTNLADRAVDLSGWTISDELATTCTLSHALISPGGYLVIADSTSSALEGEVVCAGLNLANGGDTVKVMAGVVELDAVAYVSGGVWPNVTDGVSFSLDPDFTTTTSNDSGGNWCSGPAGGTPAGANGSCP